MMFTAWNPWLRERTLSVLIKQGNHPRLQAGTQAWMDAALTELGLGSAGVSGWSLTPTRCSYVSDYPGEPDWRDRWPPCWRLELELASDPADAYVPPLPDRVAASLHELDATWDGVEDDAPFDRCATVIALRLDADVAGVTERAQAALASSPWDGQLEVRHHHRQAPAPSPMLLKLQQQLGASIASKPPLDLVEVQVTLSQEGLFPAAADDLEALQRELVREGLYGWQRLLSTLADR